MENGNVLASKIADCRIFPPAEFENYHKSYGLALGCWQNCPLSKCKGNVAVGRLYT